MKEQKKTLHMAGKLITLIQLILAVGLIAVIWNSGLVPTKYLVAIIIVLLILNIVKYTRGIRTYESDCRKME